MKACPTCNRTYPDDTLAFCLMDGSVLSAPYDPAATKSSGPARDTNPPPTEVLMAGPQALPPTQPAAAGSFQPTIAAPFVPQAMQRPAPPFAPAEITEARPLPEVVRWMFILRGGIAILFGISLFLWRS